VLTAFQNVADALYALQSDAESLRAAVAAEAAAQVTLDLTRKQLALGAVTYLALLSAQQAYLSSGFIRRFINRGAWLPSGGRGDEICCGRAAALLNGGSQRP